MSLSGSMVAVTIVKYNSDFDSFGKRDCKFLRPAPGKRRRETLHGMIGPAGPANRVQINEKSHAELLWL